MKELIGKGVKAPDFTLHDQENKAISLADFKGKKVLLSWHPLAWTSVCLDQMRALERNYEAFAAKNTVPLGLSIDPQPSKAAWAAALCLEKLRILSDFNPLGAVSRAYGNFADEYQFSGRACVLIDEDGKVIWSKSYDLPVLPDVEEILAQL